MRVPANHVFSKRYSGYGIFGALGLLDHGFFWELDMVQCARGGRDFGRGQDRGGEMKKRPLDPLGEPLPGL